MPVPMISENWAELLTPGLRSIFQLQRDAIVAASPMSRFYNVATSTRAYEETFGVGGLGDVEEYNGTIPYDASNKLWKTTFTHKKYVKGIQIDKDLVADEMYNIINQEPAKLGLSFGRTREKFAASTLNNAFSANYPGPDSKALCATDHPYSPTDSTTIGNKGTTALSYDAVIATRKLMRLFKDDRGELVTVMPDTIVVGPDLEDQGQTILNSMQKPGTANNDANVVRGQGYQLVVWDYLTDTNNWFMVDSAMAKMHLWWFDRELLNFELDPTSDYAMVARYRGVERYSFGFDNWRWIYGHEVA